MKEREREARDYVGRPPCLSPVAFRFASILRVSNKRRRNDVHTHTHMYICTHTSGEMHGRPMKTREEKPSER